MKFAVAGPARHDVHVEVLADADPPAGRPRLMPTFTPSGRYAAFTARTASVTVAHSSAVSSGVSVLEVGDLAVRQHQHVTRGVRVRVQDREAVLDHDGRCGLLVGQPRPEDLREHAPLPCVGVRRPIDDTYATATRSTTAPTPQVGSTRAAADAPRPTRAPSAIIPGQWKSGHAQTDDTLVHDRFDVVVTPAPRWAGAVARRRRRRRRRRSVRRSTTRTAVGE